MTTYNSDNKIISRQKRAEQGTIPDLSLRKYKKGGKLLDWMNAFLMDRKAQNVADGTIYFYRTKLQKFHQYCEELGIYEVEGITPAAIRAYMIGMELKGHTPGGRHAYYRTIKTFLRWWQNETEPVGWSNPISKVKAPHIPTEQLDPVEIETVNALLATCDKHKLIGVRDRAILLTLLDTGVRATELTSMNVDDLDFVSGSIKVILGKGRKPRVVFLGEKTRKSMRRYTSMRTDHLAPLWISDEENRLTYWGVREMVRRRSKLAGLEKPPELHSFRRAFALNCLRSGMDIYTLRELMGHADLQVLMRYLKQTPGDLQTAYRRVSPVDFQGVK